MVLGVMEKEIGYTFAQSLREGGVERALIVCGYEKMDEISCAGPTWVWDLKDGKITEGTLTPEHFGLKRHSLTKVAGGGPEENAATFTRLLNSGGAVPEDLEAILDFVLMNASALLVVAGVAKNYKEGTEIARKSVLSGSAWRALELFRDEGHKAAGMYNEFGSFFPSLTFEVLVAAKTQAQEIIDTRSTTAN
jgi:anthranilate phosphoribosyltransferase